ncbi:MAG: hypothetical protein JSU85_06610 [Candidatus Zixiibacteriota bacterium]|nr:MAG: hypothetical protein JSU85_06610 [candidate division Zixibacteria bacterium]
MYEDARGIWPDFSTSPQQIDPVVHMMFRALAGKLKDVNDKINDISESIISDLACRIFFDGLLHPIPSSTILKFSTGSSITGVDILTESCWVNTSIQPSVTFYFSPVEPKELYPVEAAFAFSIGAEGINILWTNPEWEGRGEFLGHFEMEKTTSGTVDKDYIYIGLISKAPDLAVPQTDIFIQGSAVLLEYLRWSRWRFTGTGGVFGDPVVSGQEKLNKIRGGHANPELSVWGHNYYPFEHKEEYQEYYFDVRKGMAGDTPLQLRQILSGASVKLLDNLGPLYWIQVQSDRKIPLQEIKSFELAATNCVVGLNAHYLKQNYFYHGPGPMEIRPQNTADEIFEIVSLDDNQGREYANVYTASGDGGNENYFIPRIDGNVLSLIVNPPESGPIPDRFSLSYRISSGEIANGINAGLLNSLYNPHPGIESVINITKTRGGTSARSFKDMIKAFPRVLQSHNRAVVPSDFESLAISFDKRIVSAEARPGSVERDGVLRGCIEVEVDMGGFSFDLTEEGSLFLTRLAKFLEMRSPIGTVVTARFSD